MGIFNSKTVEKNSCQFDWLRASIGAAIAIGLGVLGPALGQGAIGMKACENIGKYPESANKIRQVMFVSMGIIETLAIYVLLIAGGLVYFLVFG